ncbi:unnamed protein product [Amoebophrya sp. A25]|nr:unnamed protein product [Amoebophrya sp. A25]|eukprot:GSA25T00019707001.1
MLSTKVKHLCFHRVNVSNTVGLSFISHQFFTKAVHPRSTRKPLFHLFKQTAYSSQTVKSLDLNGLS